MRTELQRAAEAHGRIVAAARALFLAHCHAAGGTPQHNEEELERLRVEVAEASQELVDACDAKPIDLDELVPK